MSEIAQKYEKVSCNIKYPDTTMLDSETKETLLEEYRTKQRIIEENFMHALICKHEVKNNPKARRCFELAWEYGHSSGFSEVENYFEEFVELIK